MKTTTQSWILRDDDPVPTPGVPNGVEYHRVFAGEHRRILRGVATIALLALGVIGFGALFNGAATILDRELFERTGPSTPLKQAFGALSMAVLIPYAMLLQRVFYRVPARSLHSVAGRFRFGVLGRALLAFGPLVLVMAALSTPDHLDTVPWTTVDLVALYVVVMVLTPLAAAGEEYGFRGLMFRVLGGWTKGARSGAALGIVVTTVSFALAHGTVDPFLLTSYLVLFSSMAIVTWRTGGLEVAVVLHGVYNVALLLLATTLHVDVGGQLADRAAAVGSVANLAPSAALILVTAIVWWMTREGGPARTPAAG